jgi:hypothetical protein
MYYSSRVTKKLDLPNIFIRVSFKRLRLKTYFYEFQKKVIILKLIITI